MQHSESMYVKVHACAYIQPKPPPEALDEALIVGILGLYIWQPCSVARDDLLAKPPKVIMMDHYEKNRLFCG